MSIVNRTPIVGVFSDVVAANSAVKDLVTADFRVEQVGVITKNDAHPRSVEVERDRLDGTDQPDDQASEGALVGAITGAGIGTLVGVGVLTGAIPIVGPALMAGTLGVLASNAIGGAAIVGIVGALTGWGVPEEHAQHYEREVSAGRAVVVVHTEERREEAWDILQRHGAHSRDLEFTRV